MNDMIERENLTPVVNNSLVEIEKSRAIQEVQAKMIIAKKFPRDEFAAATRIMKACARYSLAEKALYSYPKGKTTVSDAGIRLAEVMAQNWGNIDFGIRELERKSGSSIAESYCWDIETNTTQTKIFEVPHYIDLTGGGKKILTSGRDIYEQVANQGARRLRACILGIIPIDIKEDAVEVVRKTLKKGREGKTMEERIQEVILGFDRHGVSQAMIEARLGHKAELITPDEIVELHAIWNSIREGAKRHDFFDLGSAAPDDSKELSEELKSMKPKTEKPKIKPVSEPGDFDNFK